MPGSIQDLRRAIQDIRDLSKVAEEGKVGLTALASIYTTFLDALTAGTIIPREAMVAVKSLSDALDQLGLSYKQATFNAANAAQQFAKVEATGVLTGVPIGLEAPPRGIAGRETTLTGAGGLLEVAKFARSAQGLDTLNAAQDKMIQQYATLGITLTDFHAELESGAGAWQIEAQGMATARDGAEILGTVYERIDAITGRRLQKGRGIGLIAERLGTDRFAAFDQQLHSMGFNLEKLGRVEEEAASGMIRVTAATEDQHGATRRATFMFDRWGRSIGDASTRFGAFDTILAKNISKVLKWAIAVRLVYGAFQQLQNAAQFTVELEDSMADLAIITGESTEEVYRFFDSMVAISMETGTALDKVAAAADDAFRARSMEGADVALELLGDSAIFAKLSGVELDKSLDILVSSLAQLDDETLTAQDLMNKWVAVSRTAKVSIADLGTSFATVAADAQAAGVDIDELNGMIAAMATVTKLSPQQTANAVRAITAAFASESTQQTIEKYGIAVKEVDTDTGEFTGSLRDLDAVMEDIYDRYKAGLISEEALGEIGAALGGQGARRRTQVIAILKRYDLVLKETMASEQAEGELQDAMATKTDTLKTAIENLSTALKELTTTLGVEGGMLDFVTKTVKVVSQLVGEINDLTKVMGPAATAAIGLAAAWALSSKMALGPRMMGAMGITGGGGMMGGGKLGAGARGLLPGALMAAPTAAGAAKGEIPLEEAAPRIGATLAGAFVGNMVMPGFGGIIGAFIADAFVSSVVENRKSLATAMEPIEEKDLTELQDALARIREEQEWLGKVPPGRATAVAGEQAPMIENLREQEQAILRQIDLLERRNEAEEEYGTVMLEATLQRYQEYQKYYEPELAGRMAERRMELPVELASGDITSARDYNKEVERTFSILDQLPPVYYALEKAAEAQGTSVISLVGNYADLGAEMAGWDDESLQFIETLALGVLQLEAEGAAADVLRERLNALVDVFKELRKEEAFAAWEGPTGFTDYSKFTRAEFEQIMQEAEKLQQKFVSQVGAPENLFDEAQWVSYIESNYEVWEGIDEQFVRGAIQRREELEAANDKAFNVRRLKDVDPSKMGEIARANRYWMEYLSRLKGQTAQQYMEMEGQQFNLILGPGNELQQLNSTSEAMNFTLQDILEVEEKQLEGMWNIPSGATFWVPLTSLFYQQQGGGGFPELPELLPPTQETAVNTRDTVLSVEEANLLLARIAANMPEAVRTGELAAFLEAEERALQPVERAEYGGRGLRPSEEPQVVIETESPVIETETPMGDIGFWNTLINSLNMLPFDIGPTDIPTPVEVQVEAPQAIEGEFTITNNVVLDGRQIAAFVNRIVEKALTTVLRSNKTRIYNQSR